MAEKDDWRLTGQEGFLRGQALCHRVWAGSPSQENGDPVEEFDGEEWT